MRSLVFEPWQAAVDWFTYTFLGLSPTSPAASALNFFIFDTVKIFILLVVIIFGITFLRSFFSPEKTRAGVALGTALAFMMAVTALSLPEMILLRKVLKRELLAVFVGVVGTGIILVGYLFNWIVG